MKKIYTNILKSVHNNVYMPRGTSVTPLELSNVYIKSCQLTKVKLACNKIWTHDLLLLYMTQLPSQPNFNHALST